MEDNIKKEKVISWGVGFYDPIQDKSVTHNVTNIFIDSHSSMVKVIIEHGIDVKSVNLSIEESQEIGFINIQALKHLI